jgi:serine/threonine-protein kinase RIM15
LQKNIKWHDEEMDISISARNLMESFLEMDQKIRLGCNGADEIKSHLWFDGVDWNDLNLQEAQFVPQIRDETDTDYFDVRGAKDKSFDDEDTEEAITYEQKNLKSLNVSKINEISSLRDSVVTKKKDSDFGGFMYRNLPLLEKANQKLVQKLKSDFIGAGKLKSRTLLNRRQTSDFSFHMRKSSSLSRAGFDSESETFDMKSNSSARRSRQASVPLGFNKTDSKKRSSMSPYATFAVTKSSQISNSHPLESDSKTMDILIAGSSDAIMCDFLEKLGCRIIQVTSGPEALALALFDIKFDAIFLDSQLQSGNFFINSSVL